MFLKDIPSKEFYSFFSLTNRPLLFLFYKHYCGLKILKKKKKEEEEEELEVLPMGQTGCKYKF